MEEREIRSTLDELARSLDAELTADGIAEGRRSFVFSADLRYIGQFHELEVPLTAERRNGWWNPALVARSFVEAHERLYGHADAEAPVEIVNLRVEAIGLLDLPPPAAPSRGAEYRPAAVDTRKVYVDRDGGWQSCTIHRRDSLREGAVIDGLAIVEQADSTVLIPAGFRAVVGTGLAMRLGRQ